MTSIIKIQRQNEIIILTDGLAKYLDGSVRVVAKCSMLPRAPALIACRGVPHVAALAAADCYALSFDQLVAEGAALLRFYFGRFEAKYGFRAIGGGEEEITIAGWSEQQQRLAAYFLVPDSRYESVGIKPFELVEQKGRIVIAPGPPTAEHADAFNCPDAERFDVAKDGRRLIELQRSWSPEYRSAIGVHVMAYRVTKDGVSASVVYRWPGEELDPASARTGP